MFRKSRAAVLIFFLVLSSSLVSAQTGGFAGSFSRLGFGPRGMAIGNVLTSTPQEGVYAYYNPALTASVMNNTQLDISTALMSFDRTLHAINSTFPLPPSAGLSFSIMNANVNDIDGRTDSGYPTEMLSTHEYQFSANFGLRLNSKFHLGLGIRYYIADFHSDLKNSRGFGFNLGILYKPSEKLNIGLAILDLLSEYSWNAGSLYGESTSSNTVDHFPVLIRSGVSYNFIPGLIVILEPGVMHHPSTDAIYQMRTGARYQLHERITLRAGWQIRNLEAVHNTQNFSGGFSIHLPFDLFSPSIDYAFVPEPGNISSMHLFGLQLYL